MQQGPKSAQKELMEWSWRLEVVPESIRKCNQLVVRKERQAQTNVVFPALKCTMGITDMTQAMVIAVRHHQVTD